MTTSFETSVIFNGNVMSTAWNLAKEAFNHFQIGKVKEYFASALKLAWKMFRESLIIKVDKEAEELLLTYANSNRFITNVSRNMVYERMIGKAKFEGKEYIRMEIFLEKIREGYVYEVVNLKLTDGRFLNKSALKKGSSAIYGLDKVDIQYIQWLQRRFTKRK